MSIDFFKNNTEALRNFLSYINQEIKDSSSTPTDFELNRNKHIATIISSMLEKPLIWDKFCKKNIEWIGNEFLADLNITSSNVDLNEIYERCYRFLVELDLSSQDGLWGELSVAADFAFQNIESFSPRLKSKILWAMHKMPITILKPLIQNEQIKSISCFNETIQNINKKNIEWDTDLTNREKRINDLKSLLEKHEKGFNFVGLYKGFDQLSDLKNTEKKHLFCSLVFLSILIVTLITLELIFIFSKYPEISSHDREFLVLTILPSASLIAVLIYYFRILLFNYKSIKSQLLQIELRKTLCAFIQNYIEYSSKLNTENRDSLSKFENIIFSDIIQDERKLPLSTYDGTEQLLKQFIALIKK